MVNTLADDCFCFRFRLVRATGTLPIDPIKLDRFGERKKKPRIDRSEDKSVRGKRMLLDFVGHVHNVVQKETL